MAQSAVLVALLVAGTVVGLAGCVFGSPGGAPQGGTPASPAWPWEIASVHPAEESRVCRLPQVRVELRLTDAMRKGGAFDPSSVQLVLDGSDVTRQMRVLGTMDFPQSRASLVYAPPAPLAVGTHHAAITFPAAVGRTTYRWAFTVAEIPCP